MPRKDLIIKLDGFTRKYYTSGAIRGALISVTVLTAGVLFVAFAEYFARFGVVGRTILFYSLAIVAGIVLFKMVAIPLFKMFRLGGLITHEDASKIVGDHFPEIKDKLLNTLQLQQQISGKECAKEVDKDSDKEGGVTSENAALLLASVERRTKELSPVTFSNAVNLRANLKYLKYAGWPLAIMLLVLFFEPRVILEPTERIIQHRVSYVTPAPFKFELVSAPLSVASGSDFTFAVKVVGEVVPSTVFVTVEGNRYRMERLPSDIFQFEISSVNDNIHLRCEANGWESPSYILRALPVPGVLSFSAEASPPSYTGLDRIVQENHGDLIVPEGSVIKWECRVYNTDSLGIRVGDSVLIANNLISNIYTAGWLATSTLPYWFVPTNQETGSVDSMRFSISVVADSRPLIRVVEIEDTVSRKLRYFSGSVGDDYGFSRLAFASRTSKADGVVYTDLPRPEGKSDEFYFTWDITPLDLQAGDVVEYWLVIWDNDRVNGAKSTKSATRVFAAPSSEELIVERDEANEEIKTSINDAVDKAEELREEIEALKERLREERDLDWKDEKAIENLMEKQKELLDTLEEINKANEEKNERLNEFSPQEERILEKNEELQKLMEEVMTEELRQLYEKMQELMKKMDPDEIQEHLDQMDVGQDALEKELDRALEQFKQLEWEVKMEEVVEELEKLAEKQDDLATEAEDKEKSSDELLKEQEELNKDFEEIQDSIRELEKMNDELADPNTMLDSKSAEESIKEEQKNGTEKLQEGKKKKASDSQKKASEEMKELAKQMESMQMESESEDLEEDMDALRALLENIIALSFEEEGLMAELKTTDALDPRYVLHGQTQRSLKDDAKMVEDSLFALSLRVRALKGAVNREVGLVNHHMEKALGGFGDRKTADIAMNQQYVMTSFNNLALLLDEALQQMQNKQECDNPGTGNCNKPGGSGKKPCAKPGEMKQMQEALGKKLEEMKEKMSNNPNKGECNKQNGGLSKQLAELAAQQSALRQLAQEKAQEMNDDGSGDGGEMQKIAEEMEKLERDLVNRTVDAGTVDRQREILSRLLKAEEAERVRGEKSERKSSVGNQGLRPDSPQAIDYLRIKANEIDLIKTVPPDLSPYYRDKVNDYFKPSPPLLP